MAACGLDDALVGGKVKPALCSRIGYGGAAFGGKTEGLVGVGLIAGMTVPGVRIGYFRRTFTELEGSDGPIERTYDLYSRSGATYNQARHVWTWPENDARLHFCHCQNESDISIYQSWAFDILLLDEATTFSWYIVDYLLVRNRASKTSTLPKPFALMTANPGGVGHVWYMQVFGISNEALDDNAPKHKTNPQP